MSIGSQPMTPTFPQGDPGMVGSPGSTQEAQHDPRLEWVIPLAQRQVSAYAPGETR
jgi:hypothetical protein